MTKRPASRRKLRKAREAGLHPLSQRFAWLGSIVVIFTAALLAKPAVDSFLNTAEAHWRSLGSDPLPSHQILEGTPDLLTGWVAAFAAVLALAWLTACLLSLLQTGFSVSRRLRPRSGPLTSLFQVSRWQRTGWRFVGACLIVVIASLALLHGLEQGLSHLAGGQPAEGAWPPTLIVFIVLFLMLGVADVLIERRLFARDMQMTPREIRQEQRNSGISPELRQVRRKRARKMSAAAAITPEDEVLALVDWERLLLVTVAWAPDKWTTPRIAALALQDLDDALSSLQSRSIPIIGEPALARRLFRSDPGLPVPPDTLDELALLLSEYPTRLSASVFG